MTKDTQLFGGADCCSGMRCCPQCGADKFDKATCESSRGELGGYKYRCQSCGWRGFAIQLAKKSCVTNVSEIPVTNVSEVSS